MREPAAAAVWASGSRIAEAASFPGYEEGSEFADRGLEAVGFTLQGGYVIAERFQPVARWSVVFPEDDGDREEILGGLSIYLKKHSLKWQTDAGVIAEEVWDDDIGLTGEIDIGPVVRSQLQAVF
jgi:hypothetical protein